MSNPTQDRFVLFANPSWAPPDPRNASGLATMTARPSMPHERRQNSSILKQGPKAHQSRRAHGCDERETVRTLLSIWAWLAIMVIAIGGFFVQLILFALTAWFDPRRIICGRCFRLLGVACAYVNPFWQFGVHGELPSTRPGKTVVVSNHRSNADSFLISYLPWEMKWLGKESLMKIPFVGWSMTLAGDIPISRGSPTSAREAMGHCAKILESKMPIMIFPEGTRALDSEMGPFKDGAFRIALETGADILPVAIRGTEQALPKHDWRFNHARAWVAVGQAIPTTDLGPDDLDMLKEQTRVKILDLIAELNTLKDDSETR